MFLVVWSCARIFFDCLCGFNLFSLILVARLFSFVSVVRGGVRLYCCFVRLFSFVLVFLSIQLFEVEKHFLNPSFHLSSVEVVL